MDMREVKFEYGGMNVTCATLADAVVYWVNNQIDPDTSTAEVALYVAKYLELKPAYRIERTSVIGESVIFNLFNKLTDSVVATAQTLKGANLTLILSDIINNSPDPDWFITAFVKDKLNIEPDYTEHDADTEELDMCLYTRNVDTQVLLHRDSLYDFLDFLADYETLIETDGSEVQYACRCSGRVFDKAGIIDKFLNKG